MQVITQTRDKEVTNIQSKIIQNIKYIQNQQIHQ